VCVWGGVAMLNAMICCRGQMFQMLGETAQVGRSDDRKRTNLTREKA